MRDYTAPMRILRFSLLICALSVLTVTGVSGRQIPVKEDAAKYLAHAELTQNASIAADFLGRYLPLSGATVYSDEYIFVEVAFFGPKGSRTELKPEQFTLTINGTTLLPQPPGTVAPWNGALEMSPRPQIATGRKDGAIEIGGSGRAPQLPADTPQTTTPVPQVPVDPSNGQVKPKTQTPDEAVKAAELPTGTQTYPVAGYLFFAYEGKLKKIKHAELHYKGPLGDATLTLR
jgi:hypothetical protein